MTTNGDDKSVRARDIIGSQVIAGDNNIATMKDVKVTLPQADMGGQGNDIAAGLGAEAIEGLFGRGDDKGAVAAAVADGTRPAPLAIAFFQVKIEL